MYGLTFIKYPEVFTNSLIFAVEMSNDLQLTTLTVLILQLTD